MRKIVLIFWFVCVFCCTGVAQNRLSYFADNNNVRAGYFGQDEYSILSSMNEVKLNVALIKLGVSLPLKPREVKRLTKWKSLFENNDIAFVPVINFLGSESRKHNFRKYVDSKGQIYPKTPCFLEQKLWQFTQQRIRSVANYQPDGIVLDLEMYYSKLDGRYSEPCYCDHCITTFAKGQGLEDKSPNKLRKQIIKKYSEQFYDFQKQVVVWYAKNIRQSIPDNITLGAFHIDTSVALRKKVPIYDGLAIGLSTLKDKPDKSVPVFSFTEYTYLGKAWHNEPWRGYINRAKDYFDELRAYVIQVPGIKMESFTPDEFGRILAEYKQFWIFRLSALVPEAKIMIKGTPAQYWNAIKKSKK